MYAQVVEFLAHGAGSLVDELTIPGSRGCHTCRELGVAIDRPWTCGTVLQAKSGNVQSRDRSSVTDTSTVLTSHDQNLPKIGTRVSTYLPNGKVL